MENLPRAPQNKGGCRRCGAGKTPKSPFSLVLHQLQGDPTRKGGVQLPGEGKGEAPRTQHVLTQGSSAEHEAAEGLGRAGGGQTRERIFLRYTLPQAEALKAPPSALPAAPRGEKQG